MTDVAWIIFVDPGAILYGILGGSIVFLFLESIKQIGRIVYRRFQERNHKADFGGFI